MARNWIKGSGLNGSYLLQSIPKLGFVQWCDSCPHKAFCKEFYRIGSQNLHVCVTIVEVRS